MFTCGLFVLALQENMVSGECYSKERYSLVLEKFKSFLLRGCFKNCVRGSLTQLATYQQHPRKGG